MPSKEEATRYTQGKTHPATLTDVSEEPLGVPYDTWHGDFWRQHHFDWNYIV